jgi:hypothetical protein
MCICTSFIVFSTLELVMLRTELFVNKIAISTIDIPFLSHLRSTILPRALAIGALLTFFKRQAIGWDHY